MRLDFRLPFYHGNKKRFQLDNIYDLYKRADVLKWDRK